MSPTVAIHTNVTTNSRTILQFVTPVAIYLGTYLALLHNSNAIRTAHYFTGFTLASPLRVAAVTTEISEAPTTCFGTFFTFNVAAIIT